MSVARQGVFQAALVRMYKWTGMAVLALILVGLVSYVAVHVVYFFNETWVRPIVLSSSHPAVVAQEQQVAMAQARVDGFHKERADLQAQRDAAQQTIVVRDQFLRDAAVASRKGDWFVWRRALDDAQLDRDQSSRLVTSISERLRELDERLTSEQRRLDSLKRSPYHRAIDTPISVVFVPYAHLPAATAGQVLYACRWHVLGCARVGKVVGPIDGEVVGTHPNDNSQQRGIMLEVELGDRAAAEDHVLFLQKKPLWIF